MSLISLVGCAASAQRTGTSFYSNMVKIAGITQWNAAHNAADIREYYEDGSKKTEAHIILNHHYVPAGPCKTYFPNGKVCQDFNDQPFAHLITYDDSGRKTAELNYDPASERYIETQFFTNGNKWQEQINGEPDYGGTPINGMWFGPDTDRGRSFMYQQSKGSPWVMAEYYPNGKPMHIAQIVLLPAGSGYWKHRFYTPEGIADPTTSYEPKDSSNPNSNLVKNGIWISYYANGNKEKEERYRDNEKHGTQQSWYENGQLRERAEYENDRAVGVAEKYRVDGSVVK